MTRDAWMGRCVAKRRSGRPVDNMGKRVALFVGWGGHPENRQNNPGMLYGLDSSVGQKMRRDGDVIHWKASCERYSAQQPYMRA